MKPLTSSSSAAECDRLAASDRAGTVTNDTLTRSLIASALARALKTCSLGIPVTRERPRSNKARSSFIAALMNDA